MNSKAFRASLLVRHSNPELLQRAGVTREIYEQIYNGHAPWEIAGPQPSIVELEALGKIRGAVLDVGCGSGDIALFLAQQGHEVVGIDFVPSVLEIARKKATERGLSVKFLARDALELSSLGRRFDTIIDSATFHTFSDEHRYRYAESLKAVTSEDTVLHLLCFSDREPYVGGPRHISEAEIRDVFSNGWQVSSVREVRYTTHIVPAGALAWLAEIRRA